jgi:hypothetical protein
MDGLTANVSLATQKGELKPGRKIDNRSVHRLLAVRVVTSGDVRSGGGTCRFHQSYKLDSLQLGAGF